MFQLVTVSFTENSDQESEIKLEGLINKRRPEEKPGPAKANPLLS
jgi:hypothetical protein